jgi:hypothetical protein
LAWDIETLPFCEPFIIQGAFETQNVDGVITDFDNAVLHLPR